MVLELYDFATCCDQVEFLYYCFRELGEVADDRHCQVGASIILFGVSTSHSPLIALITRCSPVDIFPIFTLYLDGKEKNKKAKG